VVGERTFGQGIVRSLFQLKSGVGAVKLPVATYYRPNGKSMNRYPDSKDSDDWGVIPDEGYEVALTNEEAKRYEKDRAERDVLTARQRRQRNSRTPVAEALEYILATTTHSRLPSERNGP